jgi:hypothetical protein
MKKTSRADNERDTDRPGPLDRNRTFNAPVRASNKFDDLQKNFGLALAALKARTWEKHGMRRIYFPDRSLLWFDETGMARTNGGEATRFKLNHPVIQ